jgi:hypothetical protein
MLFGLFGCGSGGGGGSAAAPPPAGMSFERFVRDVMTDDENAPPRDINDVPFTIEVGDGAFDDAFPA